MADFPERPTLDGGDTVKTFESRELMVQIHIVSALRRAMTNAVAATITSSSSIYRQDLGRSSVTRIIRNFGCLGASGENANALAGR